MPVLPFMPILVKLAVAGRLLVRAAMVLMGLGVLVWVVDRSPPAEAEVVIHVTEPDVEIRIGDEVHPIAGLPGMPIVCRLPPGSYSLTMWRGDRLLNREALDLAPGAHLVCTAWDPQGGVQRARAVGSEAPRTPRRHGSRKRGRTRPGGSRS